MPTRRDMPDESRRLDSILRDLGYLKGASGKIDLERAHRVLGRRVLRAMPASRFEALVKGRGAAMTVREAVMLAEGLGFNVLRVLYEPDGVPKHPERPKNLFDELDLVGIP